MGSLIADGFLGKLREVHVHGLTSDLADPKTPLCWRQMTKYSGFNMLTLGILHETVLRWVRRRTACSAMRSKPIPQRLDPETGKPVGVGTPDSVQVLTIQEDGSCGIYRFSGVVWQTRALGIALYGSEGTLIYDLTRDEIAGARRDEPALLPLPIPDELRGAGRSRPTSSRPSAVNGPSLTPTSPRGSATCSSPRPSRGARAINRPSRSP